MMSDQTTDRPVLQHIEELVAKEHRLQGQSAMTQEDVAQLHTVQIELDQCWDLLRQRRALRTIGQDPEQAHIRPPEIVEKYEQ
jgi:Protein of unknown function (DUF2630)